MAAKAMAAGPAAAGGSSSSSGMGIRFWFCVFSAVVLLAVALLGAWLPRWLAHRGSGISKSPNSLSSKLYHLGNCLSGGVMLSAGFCHLLADALPALGFWKGFPMANFLAALGLLLTLAADQVVHAITDPAPASAPGTPPHHTATELPFRKLDTGKDSPPPAATHGCCPAPGHAQLDVEMSHSGDIGAGKGRGATGGVRRPGAALVQREGGGQGVQAEQAPLLLAAAAAAAAAAQAKGEEGGGGRAAVGGAGHDCGGGPQLDALLGEGGRQLSFATAVLLACALCVHSVLEGMALGAQQNMVDTEDIMIAIAAHKGLAAYALGASVVETKASAKRFWTVILSFSCASPVGIFIGYALSSVSDSKGGAALSALASGTFLYVAMMEVIPRELADPHLRLYKMLCILVGFALMSLLAIWA